MKRSFVSQIGYGGKRILYFADLKNYVKKFNSLPENRDARIPIKLTGSSEPYAYYAIFRSGVLEERFLIYANLQWGMVDNFVENLHYDYYNAWGTWSAKILGRAF